LINLKLATTLFRVSVFIVITMVLYGCGLFFFKILSYT
jgi:hypothetical protein